MSNNQKDVPEWLSNLIKKLLTDKKAIEQMAREKMRRELLNLKLPQKRKDISDWFDVKKPSDVTPPLIAFLIGFIFLIIGFANLFELGKGNSRDAPIGIFLGMIIISLSYIFYRSKKGEFETALAKFNSRPSDDQLDQWINEDINHLCVPRSLIKFGVEEEDCIAEPVIITGPDLWSSNCIIGFRSGDDGDIRFTPMKVTLLNFTQDQLMSYSCLLDLRTGQLLNESTDEYFYRDVVSISTRTESKNVRIDGEDFTLSSAETFQLTTSGGTSVSITLRSPDLVQRYREDGLVSEDARIPTTTAEKAITSVRRMLREKKSN